MKFYRIKQSGYDIGRFYLMPDGTGRMEISGHDRPLEIVPKVEGERWTQATTTGRNAIERDDHETQTQSV